MEFQELELDELILKAIEKQGFKKPTKIQKEEIPNALSGFDVLGEAPTGTGKTAAFVIPCLQHLLDFPSKKIGLARVLILTPTRELAIQVTEHARAFCSELPNIKIGTIIGGVEHQEQLSVISEKTDIVVATPGRLLEYLKKKSFDIKAVEILVLDEADRMLDMGFVDDVIAISKQCSRREQTLLFSATLEGKILTKFANEILNNPVEIHIDSPRSEKKKIKQYKYYADDLEHKILLLEHLLKDPKIDKPIVFIKTRERLMELSVRLQKDGFRHVFLKGEMEQSKRQEAIKKYANNEVKILLSTDVAARGIDVSDLTHIINYNLPDETAVYIHRSGRTGRADKTGVCLSLIHSREKHKIKAIEKQLGQTIERAMVPSAKQVCEKQLFNHIDRLEKVDIMRDDIADYLPIVFRKLGWLTPEELITRVVALNFNRFLDYYKDAKDLNFDDSKPEKKDKKSKSEKKDYDDSGLQRLFFSKGKKDKIKPNNIIGKINDVTGTKNIRIGRIDMMENFSFVDVDQDQAQFIVDCFADDRKNTEGIRVEITTSDPKPKKKKEKKQFDDDRPERKNRDKFGDRSYKS